MMACLLVLCGSSVYDQKKSFEGALAWCGSSESALARADGSTVATAVMVAGISQ